MVGGEHQVRAEQLVRVALERLAHAVGEEADARDARHRDDEGRGEHAELARSPVAREHAQCKHKAPCQADHRGAAVNTSTRV